MTMDLLQSEPPLPCPYCGSEAILENSPYGGHTIYVRCTSVKCLACGPEYDQDGSKWNAVARAVKGAKGSGQTTPATVRELVESIHFPKRIPVQIAASSDGQVFALCSDGTIWMCQGYTTDWLDYPKLPDSTLSDTTP